MTKSKLTKKALLCSILTILLSTTMLIGTTFAWFTDTASTSVNKIQAGTLDVQLLDAEGNSLEGETLNFKKAADHESEDILWEPGCTYELQPITIKNNGNLALKYKISISGIKGDAKLNEAIEWTISDSSLDSDHSLAAGASSDALTIKGHMKEDAGNEYQGLSIDGIAITVYATQDTVEYDSKDNQYDANAPVYKATTTAEAQAILDKIDGYAIVELAAGDYDTLYFRQSLESSTRRTDLDKYVSAYPSYYREFNNVTIKAAEDATVTCDGIHFESGLFWYNSAPASNQAAMGREESGFISYLSLKNITIEGITFNNTGSNAIYVRDNESINENTGSADNITGSALYLNGLTIKNCKGTGDTSNSDQHFFQAGSGSNDLTFCGIENGVKGLNNITITGCEMSDYSQAITFNNATAILNGLTISNNTFKGCKDNNVQISNKENHGLFTFSNNTIDEMIGEGRFVRLANAQSDAVITVDNTTVKNPKKYNDLDAQIFKVTGVSGFKVSSNGNTGWTIKVDNGTEWTANGDVTLLPAGTYSN